MAREAAIWDGIPCGISSGAPLIGAYEVAARPEERSVPSARLRVEQPWTRAGERLRAAQQCIRDLERALHLPRRLRQPLVNHPSFLELA